MHKFEQDYMNLVAKILLDGESRETRNAKTLSLFGETLVIDMGDTDLFPLLQGRKMYYKGILGELAAIVRGPKHIDDFTKWGCNYWAQWAKPDGSINVDYGNAWFRGSQIAKLKANLRGNPTDRRMIISGWDPQNLDKLDLPCCHHTYQFYVRKGEYLDMTWSQRSVDTMIGLPSDIVFAYAWLISIANEFGYKPGRITMFLGDCHIYESHIDNAYEYVYRGRKQAELTDKPRYKMLAPRGSDFLKFEPEQLYINNYTDLGKLGFELYA